jgi:hypothetical protein
MVGFSAYLVADQFDAAHKTVAGETGSAEEVYCLAEQFPEQKHLFGMRTPWLPVLMVVEFTVVRALVLYTIRALEYPFDGIVQVTPQAFEMVLAKIEAGGR